MGILESMCNVGSYLNNKNYKMTLTSGKNKTGIESFIISAGHTSDKTKNIYSKDLMEECRTRNENVIGTNLVNVINCLPSLLKILEHYEISIQELYRLQLPTFYSAVCIFLQKFNIKNIANIDEHYDKIIKFRYDELCKDINIDDIDIIEKLIKTSNDKDLITVCTFVKNVFILQEKVINLYCLEVPHLLDDLRLLSKIECIDINKICFSHLKNILNSFFDDISYSISKVLKQNAFIFNTFIANFSYNFYSTFLGTDMEFALFKNDIKSKALYTDTNNIYYKKLYKFIENKNSISTAEDIKDTCIIFINALQEQLLYLQQILINTDKEQSNDEKFDLPKVGVKFSNANKILKICEYTYQINSIQDFINVSIYHIILDNRKLLKCHNCGKYFISDVRNNEVYCRRIDPNDPHHRICSVIAAAQKNYVSSDNPRQNLYKRIYNRLKNNKEKYSKDELNTFVNKYKHYQNELLNTSKKAMYDKDYKNKKLLAWLEQYNNKLMKKYPSNRYDLKKNKNV